MNPAEGNGGPASLRPMFEQIAGRYDRINRLFTLGLDRRWRRRAVRLALAGGPKRVLDLCTGTGELLRQLVLAAGRQTEIVAVDFSPAMLRQARQKLQRQGLLERVRLVEADAARLPFADGFFDTVTVGFALRNLLFRHPGRRQHLEEIHRVLRPGGQLVAVESGQPRNRLWRGLVHAYVRLAVAPLGKLISGCDAPYHYLAESATGFYDQEELGRLLEQAGFGPVSGEPLTGGAALLISAFREGERP